MATVTARPGIKVKVGVKFPARVVGVSPISVETSGGVVSISNTAADTIGIPVAYTAGIEAQATSPATVVTYQGELYLCTVPHETGSTFQPSKWLKIVRRGTDYEWGDYPFMGQALNWTCYGPGADYDDLQDAVNDAMLYTGDTTITITCAVGTYAQRQINIPGDLSRVLIKSAATRVDPTYADFSAAYAPDWSLATNDTSDPATNTLFLAAKSAIGTMLRSKYSTIIEFSAGGNGINLMGHRGPTFQDLLLINTGNAQRGVSTGETVDDGNGGGANFVRCSVHGFMASGFASNYGGSFNLYDTASHQYCTTSCNGDAGWQMQYGGGAIYSQFGICYGNFQYGGRIKQQGVIYPGEGYVAYNRLNGLDAVQGGVFNAQNCHVLSNGLNGISLYGGSSAIADGANVSNNKGNGVSVQAGSNISMISSQTLAGVLEYCRTNNNGGAGVYALTGACIAADGHISDANASHAVQVGFDATYKNGAGGQMSNSANGMGIRVDDGGTVVAKGAKIYGNTNAQNKQVFVNRRGVVDLTGSWSDAGGTVAITSTETTPGLNSPTAMGARVINDATNNQQSVRLTSQTGTTYTFAMDDTNSIVEFNNAAAITATIPANSTTPIPIGSFIEIHQLGAGQVTPSPAAGVVLRIRGAFTKTAGQYASARLTKISSSTWLLSGDLA